jgi:dTDP-4-amino-4,6-dideoxygalactose transaminase
MQIAVGQIEGAITPKTKAIIPIHFAGASPDIAAVRGLAARHRLAVIEDACPGIGSYLGGAHAGTIGDIGAFSMHPIKTLNVMGDGGMVVTNNDQFARWMHQYRNHGMADRDHIDFWGVNMRLQPLQAIVALRVLETIPQALLTRNRNARLLDEGLQQLEGFVKVPARIAGNVESYTIYIAFFQTRNELLAHLRARGIDAKVHYPIPLHLQKAAEPLGYKAGDFPEAERQAREVLTLPCHQYVTEADVHYMVSCIREYYGSVMHRAAA